MQRVPDRWVSPIKILGDTWGYLGNPQDPWGLLAVRPGPSGCSHLTAARSGVLESGPVTWRQHRHAHALKGLRQEIKMLQHAETF